jgi:hypothetical protein
MTTPSPTLPQDTTALRQRRRTLTRLLTLAAITLTSLITFAPTASAAPASISDSCSRTVNGKYYYAEVTYSLTGGGGSSYYVSRFKTGGQPISSASFSVSQGLRTSGGYNYFYSGVVSKGGLAGNTAYFAGPSWTSYAFVWITRNASTGGTTHEKTAIMDAGFTAGGSSFSCRMLTRQP